ncbi:putative membrane protein, TIGR04086 family [Geosporobacter subterraneus DSM 17957]|uniref:Putative membrane protein, TIGR04086 family n=1 Tax=Geosporobacter subterraneus DSM 17957 TaxID=1121919 RepID=A0A1M6BRP4_9FIRM|nr:TIGR04086 family membrane protein [Geosporobacter subterraneus]SHI51361.1 putative membrane protein, TIGR04086 family [Geosporobacter subterraneus DSM 17957]
MKSNKAAETGWTNQIWVYFKGIIAAYLFSLVIFLVMALMITYTNISESILPIFTSVILILSITISGIYTGTKLKRKGWLNGALTGLVYILLLFMMSWIFVDGFSIDRWTLYRTIIAVISGGIGGMIGVNMK